MSKENNISGGFRTPLYGELIGIPTCSICKNRIKGSFKCKVYGDCLEKPKTGNAVICKHEDLIKTDQAYDKFIEIRKKQNLTT